MLKVYKSIPEEASKRRVIIPMKMETILNSRSASWLEEPGICVLEFPFKGKETELYKKLEKKISEAKVLVQSPYISENYEVSNPADSNSIFQSHAREKLIHLRNFCKYLGATSVKTSLEIQVLNKKEINCDVDMPEALNTPALSIDAFNKKSNENFGESISLCTRIWRFRSRY